MVRSQSWIIVVILLSVALLCQVAPLQGADCGLTLPCEEVAIDPDHALVIENNGTGTGIYGTSSAVSDFHAGVFGFCTQTGVGAQGWSLKGIGVRGFGLTYGVKGETNNKNYSGVYGENNSAEAGGIGVRGKSDRGNGVYGIGGYKGVYGEAAAGMGVIEGVGVFGKASASNSIGVSGFNNAGVGVRGYSNTGKAGHFYTNNDRNASNALLVETAGLAAAGYFRNTNPANTSAALRADTAGTGWAGVFKGTTQDSSRGVYIQTNGGAGLQVVGGTKDAVVPTSKGPRALSAEESTGVYFTDYGFGRLKDGKAVIPVDSLFAETVNLHQPYHVFIQSYGQAELVVTKRTPTNFEVCLRDKDTQGDGSAEFSYRLVAKRRGFEQARLEVAPGDDNAPELLPEKAGEKVAALPPD